MTTALPGSPAGEAFDQAGTINVAGQLGRGTQVRINRDQLFAWDPDVIIAERRSFYDSLRRDRQWRRLSAVRNKKIYLEPTYPFGWIEDPSGVNRLIGMYWLAGLLYPEDAEEELRSATWRGVACEFYDKFYRIRLTNARLESILQPAGAPPLETARNPAEAPAGIGGGPPSALPLDTPGAPNVTAAPFPTAGSASSSPCSLPTGPSPKPIPGITSLPGVPLDTPSVRVPGVPPPGSAASRRPACRADPGTECLPVPDAAEAADQPGHGVSHHRLCAVDQLVTLDAAVSQIFGNVADLDPLGGQRG